MKKTLKRNGRNLVSFVLAIIMMLSMTTNVFAGVGNTYIEEIWSNSQQRINYYENDQFRRYIITQGQYLWIDGQQAFENLYDTTYWCFDYDGTCFAIDKSQRLLYCRNSSLDFVATSIGGCTGFQRDGNGFGYLVYTNSGTNYYLNTIIKGNQIKNNYNYNYSYSNNYIYNHVEEKSYPYVEQDGSIWHIFMSSNNYHKYYWDGYELRFRGTNNNSYNVQLATDVQNITIDFKNGYIVYAKTNGKMYAYKLGKTSSSYKKYVGKNYSSFDGYGYVSNGYYNEDGKYKLFTYSTYEEYPYIEVSGDYYYVHVSSSKYHKYMWDGSSLYDKGTNSSSKNVKLASSVQKITFSEKGYISYANNSDYVYSYPLGKTSTSSRIYQGKYFDEFDHDEDELLSEGYIDRNGHYIEFDF